MLPTGRRSLVIGIGGGGDVVGAVAIARAIEASGGAAELGGVSWERFAIDPHHPGPRPLDKLEGIERLGDSAAALCSADGRTPEGVSLAEAGVAAHIGRPTVLIDVIGWAASRAHHADVGGPTPGGMPADSRRLEDEGIVIAPRLVSDDDLAELAERMRNPGQRLADLRAQRAANRLGEQRLDELIERHGLDLVLAGMAAVLDYAERRTRSAIEELPDGDYEATDSLQADDG